MTQAEKILVRITDEAKQTAEINIKEAHEKAEIIVSEAEKKCVLINEANEKEIQHQVSIIKKMGDSSAALLLRDAALLCKKENIENTLAAAQKKILNFPDNEYFEFLCAVIENCSAEGGVMQLNEKDVYRCTAEFSELLNRKGISLSDDTADIEGGFILKNGDIEINASISSLIREYHGKLVDSVNRILFNREDDA